MASGRERARRLVALTTASALVWLALAAGASGQARPCDEAERPAAAPADAEDLVELQATAARSALEIPLEYRDKSSDDIIFLPKEPGRRIPSAADASAEVLDWPRKGSRRLDGTVDIAAKLNEARTGVVVYACVEAHDVFGAGRYEGTFAVYGSTIKDVTYPLVVTKKWPWQVAAGVLALTTAFFVVIAFVTGSLTFGFTGNKRWWASGIGVAIAAAVQVPAYYGQYWRNETWGDDPGAHLSALAAAGFTAAVGGLAFAQRFLRDSGEAPAS